jgi:hypothetical protein
MYILPEKANMPTKTMNIGVCTTSLYPTQNTKEIIPPINAYITNALMNETKNTIMFFILWILDLLGLP